MRSLIISLAVAAAKAQVISLYTAPTGNPSITATSSYTTCPTAVTRTIVRPTSTWCPGPWCEGGIPTAAPGSNVQIGDGNVGGSINVEGDYINNKDGIINWGSITFNEYCETCENKWRPVNKTIEEQCPCQKPESRTALPGYSTTVIACSGSSEPTSTTVFAPCSSCSAPVTVPTGCTSGCQVVPAAPTAPTAAPASQSPAPESPASGAPAALAAPAGGASTPAGVSSGSYGSPASPGTGAAPAQGAAAAANNAAPASGPGTTAPASSIKPAGTNGTYKGDSSPPMDYPGSASLSTLNGLFLTLVAGFTVILLL